MNKLGFITGLSLALAGCVTDGKDGAMGGMGGFGAVGGPRAQRAPRAGF